MKKQFLILLSLFLVIGSFAQQTTVFEDWFTSAGTQNFFYRGKVTTDASSNTYMCGATLNQAGNYDILVEKYNSSGVRLWGAQYDGTGNGLDGANGIALDQNGDVYVCGTTYESTTDSNDCIVLKFNGTTGTQVWLAQYDNNDGHDGLVDIVINNDRLWVTGSGYAGANNFDAVTICYDTTGSQQWLQTYDNIGGNDGGYTLILGSGGKLLVYGAEQSGTTDYDLVLISYTSSSGTFNSANSYTGSSVGYDMIGDITTDTVGNFYLTGGVINTNTGYDYFTTKIDTDLVTVWTASFNGPDSLDDVSRSIVVDDDGNVYITGYQTTSTEETNYRTIKYSVNGTQLWSVAYNGNSDGNDTAIVAVLDLTQRNLIVSGCTRTFDSTSYNYHTVKYDSSGTVVWEIDYNSWENGNDFVRDMALDSVGNIIVTGQMQIPGTINYHTVRYIEREVITPPDTVPLSNAYVFEQNRGQLFNTDTLAESSIKYYCTFTNPGVFFADTSLSYQWAHCDSVPTVNDSLFRVDMKFVGGNPNQRIYPMDLREDYFNYIIGELDYPLINVPLYDRLISPEIYSKLDVMYFSNGTGLKHDFIMHVGGDPSDIEMKFDGADSVKVVGNNLVVYTELGNLQQGRAKAFQIDGSGNRYALSWQPTYNKTVSGTITFTNIGTYDTDSVLVFEIDWGPYTPTNVQNIMWSSYYGGNIGDETEDMVTDVNGNLYVTGGTGSHTFPVTPGAIYDNTFGNDNDAFVLKFDSLNRRVYATQYGKYGSYERSYGIDVYPNGDVIICGMTNAGALPVFQSSGVNSYNQSYGGSNDGFLCRFTPLIITPSWATYFGGIGYDDFHTIKVDVSGTLYLGGFGHSTSPLKNHSGAYYYSGSTTTGMIARFDTQDSLIWCTQVQGTAGVNKFTIDEGLNTFYMIGKTTSTSLPIVNPGAYVDSFLSGPSDGYLVMLNVLDTIIWSTYVGGSDEDELIEIDISSKDVAVVGTTHSSDFPWYYTSGQYIDSTKDGAGDMVIMMFDGFTHARTWGTYFGVSDNTWIETPAGIVFDVNDNMFIAGYYSATGFPYFCYWNSYCQSTYGGSGDPFIVSFLDGVPGPPAWCTYFGSGDFDTFKACAMWGSNFYTGGYSAANSANIYNVNPGNGAWNQPTNAGPGSQDLILSRFDVNDIATGFDENEPVSLPQMLLFPNPSSGIFTVILDTKGEDYSIRVYNKIGQLVFNERESSNLEKISTQIDMSHMSNGIYIVSAQIGDKVLSAKVIVQK